MKNTLLTTVLGISALASQYSNAGGCGGGSSFTPTYRAPIVYHNAPVYHNPCYEARVVHQPCVLQTYGYEAPQPVHRQVYTVVPHIDGQMNSAPTYVQTQPQPHAVEVRPNAVEVRPHAVEIRPRAVEVQPQTVEVQKNPVLVPTQIPQFLGQSESGLPQAPGQGKTEVQGQPIPQFLNPSQPAPQQQQEAPIPQFLNPLQNQESAPQSPAPPTFELKEAAPQQPILPQPQETSNFPQVLPQGQPTQQFVTQVETAQTEVKNPQVSNTNPIVQ